jgi:hypothetical protein
MKYMGSFLTSDVQLLTVGHFFRTIATAKDQADRVKEMMSFRTVTLAKNCANPPHFQYHESLVKMIDFLTFHHRLFNVVRAHKKKTINTVYGASAVTNKYGFTVEFIVKNSWECQKKYGNFEHDVFADASK